MSMHTPGYTNIKLNWFHGKHQRTVKLFWRTKPCWRNSVKYYLVIVKIYKKCFLSFQFKKLELYQIYKLQVEVDTKQTKLVSDGWSCVSSFEYLPILTVLMILM